MVAWDTLCSPWPHVLAWCFSPTLWPQVTLPLLRLPLLSHTQQEVGPGLSPPGSPLTGGVLEPGGAARPWKDLGSKGRSARWAQP